MGHPIKELMQVLCTATVETNYSKQAVDLFPFTGSREELIEACAVNAGRLHIEMYKLMPNDDSGLFDEELYDKLEQEKKFYLSILSKITNWK